MFLSDSDFWWFLFFIVLLGILIGAGLVLGLPWIWSLLKPLIHAATA